MDFATHVRRYGVQLVAAGSADLQCLACGEMWSAAARERERRPPRYYLCPRGCNETPAQQQELARLYWPLRRGGEAS